MIFHFLALAGLRLATKAGRRFGYYPATFYVRESLLALKVDDLDLAMDSFRLAAGRQENHPKVAILREILTSEINFRRKKLLERIETPNLSPTQREALQQGVEILDRFLEGVRSPKGMLPGAGVRRTARDATDVEEVAFEPVGGAQAPIEAESETIVEEPTEDPMDILARALENAGDEGDSEGRSH